MDTLRIKQNYYVMGENIDLAMIYMFTPINTKEN